ncbi:MAG: alpha/beta hydrolase [Proteobacteria bacterium]|nr:alpha/beta hydrolase [Pseudomonadota bacterium]
MALVLIPGFMADKDLWVDFERHMGDFGPIIHADLGQGDSIPAMARRIVADVPSDSAIVGFSMGGYVAREVARLVPRRVSALILIATSARADTVEQSQRKAAAIRLINQPFKGLSRRAIEESLNPGTAPDADLVTRIREMGVRLGGDVFRRQSNLVRESDIGRLSEIKCPTLVIAGENDRIRSLDEARELNDRIPNSTLRIVPQSGHMIPMEQPSELAEIVGSWLHKTIANKARGDMA